MKKKLCAILMAIATISCMAAGCGSDGASQKADTGEATGTVYMVGLVQYVDDASLNQIERAIEA